MAAEALWNREVPLFKMMNNPDSISEIISQFSEVSIAEKRQKQHWRAKIQMLNGEYSKAVSILSSAEIQFGPHIGLRADLATCYYLMGMPSLYDQTVNLIWTDMQSILPKLHTLTQIRSVIMVGKLLEESTKFEEAHQLYQYGLKLIEHELTEPTWIAGYQPLYYRLLAQILRFLAQYEYGKQMYNAMSVVQRLSNLDLPPFFSEEIAHATLLATFRLVDDFSYADLKKYISEQSQPVSEFMQNLFFFELVEFRIRTKRSTVDLVAGLDFYKPSNEYDEILSLIVKADLVSASAKLENAKKSLSLASSLRLLLMIQKNQIFNLSATQKAVLKSLLETMDEANQAHIHRWVLASENGWDRILVDTVSAQFQIGALSRSLDLSRKPLVLNLLHIFRASKILNWKDVANLLWGSSNASDYDRLRMLVLRTNKIFNGPSKIFELRDDKLICHIKIESANCTGDL